MNISKSQYIRGLQCVKSLWLYKHKRDVLTPADAYQQTIFSTGSKVGEYACKLFPGGIKIPFEGLGFEEKVALTKRYMDEGVETIYEATFVYHGVLVMVDILHKSSKGWEIFEVKSSTEVKDVYLQDASVQYYVLNGNGLNIHSVNIIYVNNKYVRGTELEISKLFCFENVTDKVMEIKENVPSYLSHFEKTICSHSEPEVAIGKQCFNPYSCDCMNYCWADVPEYSIFDLSRIKKEKAFELYHSGTKLIDDIADIESFSIPQQVQILSEIRSSDIINKEAISSFLDELTYPLYNLDFETFQQAIPEFEGASPFGQIPFQYSIHIENTDGTFEHLEFLGEEGKDPREALAMKLVEDIPKDVTVFAYNMGFEKGVIRSLAGLFPHSEAHLMAIHDNIKDLMTPFQKKHYYTPAMRGSYSIKYVMPALVPEMEKAYKELDGIHNGGEAMNAYATLHLMEDDEQRKSIRKSLLEYCKLDTFSMVKVLEKLKDSIG